MEKISLDFLVLILFYSFSAPCGSKYNLDWDNPKEFLEYHSCGCSDSCWIADLKTKKTNKLKLRLQCDCEHLTYSFPDQDNEVILSKDCKEFQCTTTNCKPILIKSKIEQLLKSNKRG